MLTKEEILNEYKRAKESGIKEIDEIGAKIIKNHTNEYVAGGQFSNMVCFVMDTILFEALSEKVDGKSTLFTEPLHIIEEDTVIEKYKEAEGRGMYDRIEITNYIIDCHKEELEQTGSFYEMVHYIFDTCTEYVRSTYEESVENHDVAYNRAMRLVQD